MPPTLIHVHEEANATSTGMSNSKLSTKHSYKKKIYPCYPLEKAGNACNRSGLLRHAVGNYSTDLLETQSPQKNSCIGEIFDPSILCSFKLKTSQNNVTFNTENIYTCTITEIVTQ